MSWQEQVPADITELKVAADWIAGLVGELVDKEICAVEDHWPGEHVATYRVWLLVKRKDGLLHPIAVDLEEYRDDGPEGKYFARRIMHYNEGPWGPPVPERFWDQIRDGRRAN